MKKKQSKKVAVWLFAVLLGLSFLKDDFTPDYYNSGSALFLFPGYHVSRFASLSSQSFFWFMSFFYSVMFIIFPYLIIHFYFGNKKLSLSTLTLLTIMCLSIYILLFLNNSTIDKAIIPKLNRYFHSPIMTMFFIATFTLISSEQKKE